MGPGVPRDPAVRTRAKRHTRSRQHTLSTPFTPRPPSTRELKKNGDRRGPARRPVPSHHIFLFALRTHSLCVASPTNPSSSLLYTAIEPDTCSRIPTLSSTQLVCYQTRSSLSQNRVDDVCSSQYPQVRFDNNKSRPWNPRARSLNGESSKLKGRHEATKTNRTARWHRHARTRQHTLSSLMNPLSPSHALYGPTRNRTEDHRDDRNLKPGPKRQSMGGNDGFGPSESGRHVA